MYMCNKKHVQWIKLIQQFKDVIIWGGGGGAQFTSLPQSQKTLLSALHVGHRVKYPLAPSYCNHNWMSRQILVKLTNVKFNESPSSGSGVVACGQKDRHGEANRDIFQL
jgi:hypothetical protein